MTSCCLHTTDSYFDQERAAKDLERYHKKGPQGTTRKLIDALRRNDLKQLVLLDVGGGIGIICHELISSGIEKAISVEMSSASMHLAREEATRRGSEDLFSFIHGDLVEQHALVPESDIVILDRVVCCYPDAVRLIATALAKGRHLFAISYPREKWYTRLWFRIDNWQRRRRGHEFRTYVHDEGSIRNQIKQGGFIGQYVEQTPVWNIEIYRRAGDIHLSQ